MRLRSLGTLTFALFTLGGCALLPRTGPDDGAVKRSAVEHIIVKEDTLGYEYVLIDVTRNVIPFVSRDASDEFTSFGLPNSGPPEIRLGVGDVIQVTIFESQAGGLFIPDEAGARPGNFVQLPPQEIGQSGIITVPYAGNIRAAGVTPEAVENTIVRRLQDRAIEPQVSLAVLEPNSARASVFGEVAEPGSFTLRNSGDRVLDLIAQAGGIESDAGATFVTLSRGGGAARASYNAVSSDPRENIFVAPGDSINVTSENKSFFVFGATGTVGEFTYTDSEYSLNKAIAAAAGLNDGQADPAQVLIYRGEHGPNLLQMGVNLKSLPGVKGSGFPTVYRADFRKPDSFFMAQNFHIRDGDVIYVSNADSVEISKFFGTATNITGGTTTVEADIDVLTD